MNKGSRGWTIALWSLAGLVVLAVALAYAGTLLVKSHVREWLGDAGSVEAIHVGLTDVVLDNVVVGAPKGWPAADTLRAARVTAVPQWGDLFSNRLHLDKVTVENFHMSVQRTKGRIDILPTLRERARARGQADRSEGKPKRTTLIDQLVFSKGELDFYDAVESKPPHKIVLDPIEARIGPINFTTLDEKTQVDVDGSVQGRSHQGKMSIRGWMIAHTRDADIKTALRGVDVPTLAPYLRRGAKIGLVGGTVDLDMHTRVQRQQLNASGTLTLGNLKLADDDSLLSLPRRAVIASIEDSNGKASFDFTLTGSLSNPKFALNEGLSTRLTGGLANVLGISIEGLADGIGGAVEGIGGALSELVPK